MNYDHFVFLELHTKHTPMETNTQRFVIKIWLQDTNFESFNLEKWQLLYLLLLFFVRLCNLLNSRNEKKQHPNANTYTHNPHSNIFLLHTNIHMERKRHRENRRASWLRFGREFSTVSWQKQNNIAFANALRWRYSFFYLKTRKWLNDEY